MDLSQIFENLVAYGRSEAWIIQVFIVVFVTLLIDFIQKNAATSTALILNGAGFTHTSVALRDCIAALSIPVVEVHLSNIHAREEFRHTSLTAPVAKGIISGLGPTGYLLALEYLVSTEGVS